MTASVLMRYLLSPQAQELISRLERETGDPLVLAQAPYLRGLEAPQRRALIEQRQLRLSAARRFTHPERCIFTPQGLEQASGEALSRYKADRIGSAFSRIVDLCCGLGGDSLFLHPRCFVVGIDREEAHALAYRHNTGRPALVADVTRTAPAAQMALIDPARRYTGKSMAREGGLSPAWPDLKVLMKTYPAVALKLGPAKEAPSWLDEYEWEYLGHRDECLQLVVWKGGAAENGTVRATEVIWPTPGGGVSFAGISRTREQAGSPASLCQAPGKWLYEPVKCVVRAHLFGALADECGLWQMDPQIAYLSSDRELDHPLLKTYQLIEELPFRVKEIQKALARLECGHLVIKKRGVLLDPAQLHKKFRLCGSRQIVLIVTRLGNKRVAFLAEAKTGDKKALPQE